MESSEPPSFANTRSSSVETLPADEAAEHIEALRAAGVLEELSPSNLAGLLATATAEDPDGRILDVLFRYYDGGGDAGVASRRRLADRYFAHDVTRPANAHALVARMATVAPELEGLSLSRIGGNDGALVLQAGEQLIAVTDYDFEEAMDTGEVDLRDLDAAPSISICGLVHALNILLDRVGVRERLIEVAADERCEAYVGLGVTSAMQLCQEGRLAHDDPERLMDFASW